MIVRTTNVASCQGGAAVVLGIMVHIRGDGEDMLWDVFFMDWGQYSVFHGFPDSGGDQHHHGHQP